ncbi:MAG TPA: hypothetical protein VFH31_05405 [Pyrinomonadaceae bacterium]|nr:hypothetical protein [Pyrinomonadaceae bacterium]
MNKGKSDAQELAEVVAAKRELLTALDRMANHSQGWADDDFRRFARAAVKRHNGERHACEMD